MSEITGYLLDTNVISETRRRRSDRHVLGFLAGIEPGRMFISALTLGELRKGVEVKRLSDPLAAEALGIWLDGMASGFAERVLPVDLAVAGVWGILASGRSRPVVDMLIAATAIVHGLTLVTRNLGDFDGIKVELVNPWDGGAVNPR